ncbi:MAG: neutral/alkaline non-lysosomal ceramidase N-terminal domain-containing protein, partial [Verrucomicrobiales bacterium]|nr:neutral/alkaline non-lysosomal ceramidase N-terminal domain-containing protein [Verrucomicrobiales bacterium]
MMKALLFLLLAAATGSAMGAPLKAGAATSNITPDMGVVLDGTIMKIGPAKHVHDELHARCLVLNDGTTTLAFAVCDVTMMEAAIVEEAKSLVREHLDIPPENIVISATHTHSSPRALSVGFGPANDAYHHVLARRIADGIRRAHNNLAPAAIGWGSVAKPEFVFNRRWFVSAESKRANPFGRIGERVQFAPSAQEAEKPSGPVDPEFFVLSVRHADGRPLCVLGNYGLHYIGGVPTGHVSADYFGVFADLVQQRLGADRQDPPFVGILTNGTSGDVNGVDYKARAKRSAGYERMHEVAGDLADAAAEIISGIDHRTDVKLAAVSTTLELGVRKPAPDQIAWAESLLATDEAAKPKPSRPVIYARETLGLSKYPDTVPIRLQA